MPHSVRDQEFQLHLQSNPPTYVYNEGKNRYLLECKPTQY